MNIFEAFDKFPFVGSTRRWFEWDSKTGTDDQPLSLKSSEKVLEPLEDVGQQLALTFNNEGTLLAVGGEVMNYRSP